MLDDDDRLFEYSAAGNQLGTLIPTDFLTGNGQGLFYDSAQGRLFATSQEGRVATFSDIARVPEPSLLITWSLLAGHGLLRRRRCTSLTQEAKADAGEVTLNGRLEACRS